MSDTGDQAGEDIAGSPRNSDGEELREALARVSSLHIPWIPARNPAFDDEGASAPFNTPVLAIRPFLATLRIAELNKDGTVSETGETKRGVRFNVLGFRTSRLERDALFTGVMTTVKHLDRKFEQVHQDLSLSDAIESLKYQITTYDYPARHFGLETKIVDRDELGAMLDAWDNASPGEGPLTVELARVSRVHYFASRLTAYDAATPDSEAEFQEIRPTIVMHPSLAVLTRTTNSQFGRLDGDLFFLGPQDGRSDEVGDKLVDAIREFGSSKETQQHINKMLAQGQSLEEVWSWGAEQYRRVLEDDSIGKPEILQRLVLGETAVRAAYHLRAVDVSDEQSKDMFRDIWVLEDEDEGEQGPTEPPTMLIHPFAGAVKWRDRIQMILETSDAPLGVLDPLSRLVQAKLRSAVEELGRSDPVQGHLLEMYNNGEGESLDDIWSWGKGVIDHKIKEVMTPLMQRHSQVRVLDGKTMAEALSVQYEEADWGRLEFDPRDTGEDLEFFADLPFETDELEEESGQEE